MVASNLERCRSAFAAVPTVTACARPEAAEQALGEIRDCLVSGGGIAVLTAPAGLGKTVLCRRLQAELDDRYRVILFPGGGLDSRTAFLQAALCELGRPYRELSESELRLELVQALREAATNRRPVVLIFDEAHTLPEEVLEEIRTATNVIEQSTPAVRVLLSGQFELEERLTSRRLDALNQRIGCHVHLEALTRKQSRNYILQRLQIGRIESDDIFSDDALRAICIAADGNPRCLDRLCDRSLQLAGKSGIEPIDEATVRRALDDLRQLPLHWNDLPSDGNDAEPAPPKSKAVDEQPISDPVVETGVVEFGEEAEAVEVETPPVTSTEEVGWAVPTNPTADRGHSPPDDSPTATDNIAVVEFGPERSEASVSPETPLESCEPLQTETIEPDLTKPAEIEEDGWEPVPQKQPLKREAVADVPDVLFGEFPPDHDSPFSLVGNDDCSFENRPLVLQREENVEDHYALLVAKQEQAHPQPGPSRPRAFEAVAGQTVEKPNATVSAAAKPAREASAEMRPRPDDVIDSVIAVVDEESSSDRLVRDFVIPTDEFDFDEPGYDIVMPSESVNAQSEAPQTPPRSKSDLFSRLRRLRGD